MQPIWKKVTKTSLPKDIFEDGTEPFKTGIP